MVVVPVMTITAPLVIVFGMVQNSVGIVVVGGVMAYIAYKGWRDM